MSSKEIFFDRFIAANSATQDELLPVLRLAIEQAREIGRENGAIYARRLLLVDELFVVVNFLIRNLAPPTNTNNDAFNCAVLELLVHLFVLPSGMEVVTSLYVVALLGMLRSSCIAYDFDLMDYLRLTVFDFLEASMELRGKASLLLGRMNNASNHPLKREILAEDMERLFTEQLHACRGSEAFFDVLCGLSRMVDVRPFLLDKRHGVLDACVAALDTSDSDKWVLACFTLYNLSQHEDKSAFYDATKAWAVVDVCRKVLLNGTSGRGDERIFAYYLLCDLSPASVFATDLWTFLVSLISSPSSTSTDSDVRAVLLILDDSSEKNVGYWRDLHDQLGLSDILAQAVLRFRRTATSVVAMKVLKRLTHVVDMRPLLAPLAQVVADGGTDDRTLYFTYMALKEYPTSTLMDAATGVVSRIVDLLTTTSSDDSHERLLTVVAATELIAVVRDQNTVLFDQLYPAWYSLCEQKLVSLEGRAAVLWPVLADALRKVGYNWSTQMVTFFDKNLDAVVACARRTTEVSLPFDLTGCYVLRALYWMSCSSSYNHLLPMYVEPLLELLRTSVCITAIAYPVCTIISKWEVIVEGSVLKDMCQPLFQQVSRDSSWRNEYDLLAMLQRIKQLVKTSYQQEEGSSILTRSLIEYSLLSELFSLIPQASTALRYFLCETVHTVGCSVPNDVLTASFASMTGASATLHARRMAFFGLKAMSWLASTKTSLLNLQIPLLATLEALLVDEQVYWKANVVSFIVEMKYLVSSSLIDHLCVRAHAESLSGNVFLRKQALSHLSSLVGSVNSLLIILDPRVVDVCEASLLDPSSLMLRQGFALWQGLKRPVAQPLAVLLGRMLVEGTVSEQVWAADSIVALAGDALIDSTVFLSNEVGLGGLLNGALRGGTVMPHLTLKLCAVMVALKITLDQPSIDHFGSALRVIDSDHSRSVWVALQCLDTSAQLEANHAALLAYPHLDVESTLNHHIATSSYNHDRDQIAKSHEVLQRLQKPLHIDTLEALARRVCAIDCTGQGAEPWTLRVFYMNRLHAALGYEKCRIAFKASACYESLMPYLLTHQPTSSSCFNILVQLKAAIPASCVSDLCASYATDATLSAGKTEVLRRLQQLADDPVQLPVLLTPEANVLPTLESILQTEQLSDLGMSAVKIACKIKADIQAATLGPIFDTMQAKLACSPCGKMALRLVRLLDVLVSSEVARKNSAVDMEQVSSILLGALHMTDYYRGEIASAQFKAGKCAFLTAEFFRGFVAPAVASISVLQGNVAFVQTVAALADVRYTTFAPGSGAVQFLETLLAEVTDLELRGKLITLHQSFGHAFPSSTCRLLCEEFAREMTSDCLYRASSVLNDIGGRVAKSPAGRATVQSYASIIQAGLEQCLVDKKLPWSIRGIALNLLCALEVFPSPETVTALQAALVDPHQSMLVLDHVTNIFLELAKVAPFKVLVGDPALVITLCDAAARDRSGHICTRVCLFIKEIDATPSLAFVTKLVDGLRQNYDRAALDTAISNLTTLADSPTNRSFLMDPAARLVDALSHLIDEFEPGGTRIKAAKIMGQLDVLPELPTLFKLVAECGDVDPAHTVRAINAINIVRNLATKKGNQDQLRWPKLGLLGAVEKAFVVQAHPQRAVLMVTLGVLAVDVPASIVATIAEKVSSGNAEMETQAINLSALYASSMNSYSSDMTVLTRYFSTENMIFHPILELVRRSLCGHHTQSIMQMLMGIAQLGEAAAAMLVEAHVHGLVHDVLRAYGKELGSYDSSAPYLGYCLLTLMNLSQWSAAYEPLRSAGCVALLLPVVKAQQSFSVYCMVTLCYLLGREENSDSAKQFRTNEQNMESVVDALSNTVARQGAVGLYTYSIFTFQIISRAILSLSISDENKKFLGRQKVTVPLLKIVELFVAGVEGDKMGGGIHDPLSAEYAIEALLQLSFLHDADADLKASDLFPKTSAGSLDHVVEVLTLATSSGLSAAAKVNAGNLLVRLTVKETEEEAESEVVAAGGGAGDLSSGMGAGARGAVAAGGRGTQVVAVDHHTTHGEDRQRFPLTPSNSPLPFPHFVLNCTFITPSTHRTMLRLQLLLVISHPNLKNPTST